VPEAHLAGLEALAFELTAESSMVHS
jgi:hypothetical protein